jgi:hypothetical protein
MKNSLITRFADITKLAAIFFIALFNLDGCGKTTYDSHVRLINATTDISSLTLYADDDKLNDAVSADSISAYSDVKSTTNFQAKLKRGGSETVLSNTAQNLAQLLQWFYRRSHHLIASPVPRLFQ